MTRKVLLFVLVAVLVTVAGSVVAQDDDIPTVAIIRFGPLQPFELSEQGTLDVLAANGYVDGENINIIFGDAAFDFPTANQLVENAIDEGADVIVAITTPVAQAAVNATLDMDNPPVVLFNTVTSPYGAGIADTPCLKPDHVWGSQALAPYSGAVALMFAVNPDIESVGFIYNQSEANSIVSFEVVQGIADDLDFTLEARSVTDTTEVGVAAEALVQVGIDAFFIPTDSTVSAGLPALLAVAEENGIPIIHADSGQVYAGATFGAGLSYYQEGVDTGRVLIAYLAGELDITTTGIARQEGMIIAINLDSADAEGIEIPDVVFDMADFVIEDGESSEGPPSLPDVSDDERMESDAAYLEGLFCSAERIAEEQAELDAQGD